MLLSPGTSESFNYPRGKLCVHQQTLPVTHTSPGSRKSLIYFHLSGFAQFSTLHSKCVVSRDLPSRLPSAFQGPSTPWHVHLPVLPPYRWTAFHCVVHRTVSVRSPPDGHLGCFRFSDCCEWHNDELVCTRFWWTYVFICLGYNEGRTCRARGYSACNVLRNCRTVFWRGCMERRHFW